MTAPRPSLADVRRENEELRSRLQEAQETLEAIRSGGVDALVVATPDGNRVFALQGADHPYRLFVEEMQQGAVTLSVTCTLLFCNKRFAQIVGAGDRSLLGASFHDLVAPSSRPVFDALVARSASGRSAAELELCTPAGMAIPVFLAVSPFPADDPPGLCVVVSDLTEQKQHEKIVAGEARLRAVLKEKELLLMEVHHQVRSNLQLLAGMVGLQADALGDGTARAPLIESQNRLRTIASIQEKLYGSSNLTRIPFHTFAAELAADLHRTLVKGGSAVRLEIDVDEVDLDVTTAMPLALILDELVTNAIKHGFPDQRKGVVKVGFHEFGDGRLELSVANDGLEFPSGIDPGHAHSLGLGLVAMLTRQVGGVMELRRDAGTCLAVVVGDGP
jgi:PAS domain S-box-containing protein